MDKALLRKLISTLSGYSNPDNWNVEEDELAPGEPDYIWRGPEDPIKMARNILDLVTQKSGLMSAEDPENIQLNLFYDV